MSVIVEAHAEGAVFYVRAQPGGRQNAVRGEHDGCLKVSVTQVAERGKANDAILDMLCATLGLRRSRIELLAGETDRRKRLLVRGLDVPALRARLESLL